MNYLALIGLMLGGWAEGGRGPKWLRVADCALIGFAAALAVHAGWSWCFLLAPLFALAGEWPGTGWFAGWATNGMRPDYFKVTAKPDSWIPEDLAYLDEPWNPWLGLAARGFLRGGLWFLFGFIDPGFMVLACMYVIAEPLTFAVGRVWRGKSAWYRNELLRHAVALALTLATQV